MTPQIFHAFTPVSSSSPASAITDAGVADEAGKLPNFWENTSNMFFYECSKYKFKSNSDYTSMNIYFNFIAQNEILIDTRPQYNLICRNIVFFFASTIFQFYDV